MTRAGPFLRWVGGKARLLPELEARLPADVEERRHVEPFLGGGAFFFARRPKRALLADVNERLVEAYVAVRDEVEGLISELFLHSREHQLAPAKHYSAVREQFNLGPAWFSPVELAAMLIYLNKTGFNGLYRVNASGAFNVPFGKRATFEPDVEGLREASRALAGVEIVCGDFEQVLLEHGAPGDFIYLDPPYDPASATSNFASYAAGGFGMDDQARVGRVLGRALLEGTPAMLSNHDTPAMRRLYRGLRIEGIEAPRSVGAKTREAARELIVRTY